MLWRAPSRPASLDLLYGAGGPGHLPHPPFRFLKEDLGGTSPKFDVVDRDNVKWKVKFGLEARSETAASRIVWAAGYFTTEDYYFAQIQVQNLPRLKRGRSFVEPEGTVQGVRLKREDSGEKKLGVWHWRDNPWKGSREFNGLRVLMAVLNNWDLKDENNAVYRRGNQRICLVSDLGAAFGAPGRKHALEKSKDNLDQYRRSKFIRRLTAGSVDFETPARPAFVLLIDPKEYIRRIRLEWIGREIPRSDARWIGRILTALSPRQIRDAFRAAEYSPQDVEGFAQIVEHRIHELAGL